MKTDIQIPKFNLPTKITMFFNTLIGTTFFVLVAHAAILSIYAFLNSEGVFLDTSLVVSGLDVSKLGVLGRLAILVPYLIFPVTLATCKVAGFGLTDLTSYLERIKKARSQADD